MAAAAAATAGGSDQRRPSVGGERFDGGAQPERSPPVEPADRPHVGKHALSVRAQWPGEAVHGRGRDPVDLLVVKQVRAFFALGDLPERVMLSASPGSVSFAYTTADSAGMSPR